MMIPHLGVPYVPHKLKIKYANKKMKKRLVKRNKLLSEKTISDT